MTLKKKFYTLSVSLRVDHQTECLYQMWTYHRQERQKYNFFFEKQKTKIEDSEDFDKTVVLLQKNCYKKVKKKHKIFQFYF